MFPELVSLDLQGPIHRLRLALQQVSKAELCLLALLVVVCCGYVCAATLSQHTTSADCT